MKDYKEDFLIFNEVKDLTYLDTSATALKPKCVLDKENEYYTKYGVNVHRGVYNLSYMATEEYENARREVARFINANEKEVFFVRNATEGLNVISKMLESSLSIGDHVLTTPLDHHSSILPWMKLELEGKIKLDYVKLDEIGRITLENVISAITDKTKIIAITYASNTLGYITYLKPIIEYAHSRDIIVIVDAAQYIAHKRVDVKDLDCDYLVFSGHKIMGPTGIGVVYGKYNHLTKLEPVNYGGDMNASVDYHNVILRECPAKFEAGTPAIAQAIGLGEAIRYIEAIGYDYIEAKEKELKDYLFSEIKKIDGVTVHNYNSDLAILLFNITGVHAHDASSIYDMNNVCVRAGHHCAELVSRELGINGSLRASLYFYNTKEDIDKFIKCTKETVSFFKQFN